MLSMVLLQQRLPERRHPKTPGRYPQEMFDHNNVHSIGLTGSMSWWICGRGILIKLISNNLRDIKGDLTVLPLRETSSL
jgi:hypothetical protein